MAVEEMLKQKLSAINLATSRVVHKNKVRRKLDDAKDMEQRLGGGDSAATGETSSIAVSVSPIEIACNSTGDKTRTAEAGGNANLATMASAIKLGVSSDSKNEFCSALTNATGCESSGNEFGYNNIDSGNSLTVSGDISRSVDSKRSDTSTQSHGINNRICRKNDECILINRDLSEDSFDDNQQMFPSMMLFNSESHENEAKENQQEHTEGKNLQLPTDQPRPAGEQVTAVLRPLQQKPPPPARLISGDFANHQHDHIAGSASTASRLDGAPHQTIIPPPANSHLQLKHDAVGDDYEDDYIDNVDEDDTQKEIQKENDEDEEEKELRQQIGTLLLHAKDLEAMDDVPAAEALYARALELDPMEVGTLMAFALFLHKKKGEITRAEGFFSRGLQICLPGFVIDRESEGRRTDEKKCITFAHNPIDRNKPISSSKSTLINSIGSGHVVSASTPPPPLPTTTGGVVDRLTTNRVVRFVMGFAQFLAARGDVDGATVLFRKALQIAPDNAIVVSEFAHFLAKEVKSRSLKHDRKGEKMTEDGQKEKGDRECDHSQQQEALEAEFLFRRGMHLSPNNVQVAMWYGNLLKKMRKLGEVSLCDYGNKCEEGRHISLCSRSKV